MTDPAGTLALCIPAGDAARHLPRLLDSVRRQTRSFDEVWLYDDASTDDTGAIARAFSATVVRSDVNTGPSPGKNLLAQQATAAWVHFHDADEALHPEFVARAGTWMARDQADVVLFGTEDRDDATAELMLTRQWNDADTARDAVAYCIANTVTNCGIYRRTAFLDAGGFDSNDDTRYNEDQAMHLRLALAGLRFRADEYVGVVVYRRGHSMSSGHPIECARAQYQVLANTARATGTRYAAQIGGRLWQLAGVLAGFRDWDHVRRCLDLAGRLGYADPHDEHPAVRLAAHVSPFGAIAVREAFIRAFKPRLRRNYPIAG